MTSLGAEHWTPVLTPPLPRPRVDVLCSSLRSQNAKTIVEEVFALIFKSIFVNTLFISVVFPIVSSGAALIFAASLAGTTSVLPPLAAGGLGLLGIGKPTPSNIFSNHHPNS